MSRQFYCPNCERFNEFSDQQVGGKGVCFWCGTELLVPEDENKSVKIVKQIIEPKPIEGFSRKVSRDWAGIFFNWTSATGIVFVFTIATFQFLTGHVDFSFELHNLYCCLNVGVVVMFSGWGLLFWYYVQIVKNAYLDSDRLPELEMPGFPEIIWHAFVAFGTFLVSWLVIQLPYSLLGRAFPDMCMTLRWAFVLPGAFLYPAAVGSFILTEDLRAFRPDRLIGPIKKRFFEYLFVVGLFFGAWVLQFHLKGLGELESTRSGAVGWNLAKVLAGQLLLMYAMFCLGSFFCHFACYSPGLDKLVEGSE